MGEYKISNLFSGSQFSSVQSLSCVWIFVTPWTAAHQAFLSITNFQSLLKLMSIELVMPSNYLILCHPLLLLPSIFLSIRVFSNESFLHIKWPKYWSFSFSISLSNDWIPLMSKGQQESSPTPQFTSINSSVLSFLYGPNLTCTHDYWKKTIDLTFRRQRSWHPVPSLKANRWGNSGKVADFTFLGSKITVDGDCSHEVKRCLLFGRKVMTYLDSILKSRDIT